MKKFILLIFLIANSCSFLSEVGDEDPNFLHVGTFNIAWLGDGIDDRFKRSFGDYADIAEVIKFSDAEVIALQEIENEKAVKKLLKFLPGWKYIMTDISWQLNLAILYKDHIQLQNSETYYPVKVVPKMRPALIANFKAGNFDFVMMNVHFKSTSRYDNTKEKKQRSFELRKQQAQVVNNWIDSMLTNSNEKDLIITGDFNDNPNREEGSNIKVLDSHPNMIFVTSHLKSCKNEFWDSIDHILISDGVYSRYLRNSSRNINFFNMRTKAEAKQISDHCPVVSTFDLRPEDND